MALTTTVDDVAVDVVRLRHLFVNVYFIGTAESWVLVDAALPGSADDIVGAAEATFGAGYQTSGDRAHPWALRSCRGTGVICWNGGTCRSGRIRSKFPI